MHLNMWEKLCIQQGKGAKRATHMIPPPFVFLKVDGGVKALFT